MATPRLDRREFADLAQPSGVVNRVRIMAEAEGYVMVRHPGCVPFVVSAKDLTRTEPPIQPAPRKFHRCIHVNPAGVQCWNKTKSVRRLCFKHFFAG